MKTHIQERETSGLLQIMLSSCYPSSPLPSPRRRFLWWRRGRRWSRPQAETESFWRWGRRSLRWCWWCSESDDTRNRLWPSFCHTPAPQLCMLQTEGHGALVRVIMKKKEKWVWRCSREVRMSQWGHKEKNNGIENVCSGSISQFLAGLHLSDVKTAKQGHLCD